MEKNQTQHQTGGSTTCNGTDVRETDLKYKNIYPFIFIIISHKSELLVFLLI